MAPDEATRHQIAQKIGAADAYAGKRVNPIGYDDTVALAYVHGWLTGHERCMCLVPTMSGSRFRMASIWEVVPA